MKIELIVAHDKSRGIGKDNNLPWHIPGELGYVAKTTKTTSSPDKINALIMGRKTYESLPESRRPLPDRKTIVISSGYRTNDSIQVCSSLEEAISQAEKDSSIEKAIIFGGSTIYKQALDKCLPDNLYVTEIDKKYDCDTFFPEIPASYIEKSSVAIEGIGFKAFRKIYERSKS